MTSHWNMMISSMSLHTFIIEISFNNSGKYCNLHCFKRSGIYHNVTSMHTPYNLCRTFYVLWEALTSYVHYIPLWCVCQMNLASLCTLWLNWSLVTINRVFALQSDLIKQAAGLSRQGADLIRQVLCNVYHIILHYTAGYVYIRILAYMHFDHKNIKSSLGSPTGNGGDIKSSQWNHKNIYSGTPPCGHPWKVATSIMWTLLNVPMINSSYPTNVNFPLKW